MNNNQTFIEYVMGVGFIQFGRIVGKVKVVTNDKVEGGFLFLSWRNFSIEPEIKSSFKEKK